MQAKSYLTHKGGISTGFTGSMTKCGRIADGCQVRALRLIVAFAIGMVAGMILELPELPDSPIIDSEVKIRRRVD